MQDRVLAVLDYWHKIEFFIPFNLAQRLGEAEKWQARWLERAALEDCGDASWRDLAAPDGYQVHGYNLYLGIFDQADLARLCAQHLRAAPDDGFDDAERAGLEGASCFARISLNADGVARFEAVSVSTAPWAMGRVRAAGLASLGYEALLAAKEELARLLRNFESERARAELPAALGAAEVIALQRLFCAWAGYTPGIGQPVAALELVARRKTRAAARQDAPAGDEEEDEEDEAASQIDILNSFFIQDIERAIAGVRAGVLPETLRQYLTPLDPARRIDLYSPAGRAAIHAALQPERLPGGHWLAPPDQAMSLMQQFAINTALDSLAQGGLFSVNGPPGTGKTTLLRELFADNIVRRARVLARYSHAGAAFAQRRIPVRFKDVAQPSYISTLQPELLGYEMVVASSNNAAVENISHDLPKTKTLGQPWQGSRYLQAVAHKLAAQKADGKLRRLAPEDAPWGLIACALGNARNRRRFVERFAFTPVEASAPGPAPALNIWQWLKQYTGPAFPEAARAFALADQAVTQALAQRRRYADLLAELADGAEARFLATHSAASIAALQRARAAEQAITAARERARALALQLERLRERERLLRLSAPAWWARLLRTRASRAHAQDSVANARAQLDCLAEIEALQAELERGLSDEKTQAQAAYRRAQADLLGREALWREQQRELHALRETLGAPTLPADLAQLEEESFQRDGLWHDAALATLRSALFDAALTLQQAWLAEVGRKDGGFGGNIVALTKLLGNQKLAEPAHALPIWQSLFLIVPVVSSTFASFASQFGALGPGALGWLYIDEAGQAVPQAAVGALWRARRAVVVGDPLQIEPVFTLPSRLIQALGQLSAHTAGDDYAPNRSSVQVLADRANRYGTLAPAGADQPLWIGSPLRVHRRCLEPMFSIANRIAYAGKMVFGLPLRQAPERAPLPLPSCWIDIPGQVGRGQAVPAQIGFMLTLLTGLYERDGDLPPVYIISPFKAVRLALQQALRQADWNSRHARPALGRAALGNWLAGRIGTVHTFQGKEEDTVFMLLGADQAHAGAAQWAAAKPNLLNVALTRARRRCYLVGAYELWSPLPHFEATLAGPAPMPRTDGAAFLAACLETTNIRVHAG